MTQETDRELLELAAKATGIKIDKSPYNGGGHGNNGFDLLGNAVLDWHNGTIWNPLTDDGDALRLAVKLHIDILHRFVGGQRVEALAPGGPLEIAECNEETRQAATRRAIVRAAAEIGKNER